MHIIGKACVGLDGGNVGVYEYAMKPIFPYGFEALAAGVVELAVDFGDFRRLLRSLLPHYQVPVYSLMSHV